jgi:hypothetical protein
MPTYKLLSAPTSNPKVHKNAGVMGVLTAPLHLAPADSSGYEVCPMRSLGCTKACLHTAGNPAFLKNKILGRGRKTKMYFEKREEFLSILIKDIQSLSLDAKRQGLECGVRLNATSDIMWERVPVKLKDVTFKNIMEIFPDVQFYDYTAIPKRFEKPLPANYHLTFSRKEDNDAACKKVLDNGGNVAVVFSGKTLPETFWDKYLVINGDEHDYRPADVLKKPKWYDRSKGLIVGLKAKGKARNDTSGFVITAA